MIRETASQVPETSQMDDDTVQINIIMSTHLAQTINRAAQIAGCTLAAQVTKLLEEWVKIDHVATRFRSVFFEDYLERSAMSILKAAVPPRGVSTSCESSSALHDAYAELRNPALYAPCIVVVRIRKDVVEGCIRVYTDK